MSACPSWQCGHPLFCREASHHFFECHTPHRLLYAWHVISRSQHSCLEGIIIIYYNQGEGLRSSNDSMKPQYVREIESELKPTLNPKDHTLSYYTMTGFKMILLQWKLFHSFDCVAFNHNSNQKLMFLCHDRVKEFSLHRWGDSEGRGEIKWWKCVMH